MNCVLLDSSLVAKLQFPSSLDEVTTLAGRTSRRNEETPENVTQDASAWLADRSFKRVAKLEWLLKEATSRPRDLGSVLTSTLDISLEEGRLGESAAAFLVTRQVTPRRADFLIKRGWHSGESQHFQFSEPLEFAYFDEGTGILGEVLESGATVWSNDPEKHPTYVPFERADQLRSMICAPVKYSGHLLAVISVHNRRRHILLDEEDVSFVEALAGIAAITISAGYNALTLLPNKELMLQLISSEIENCKNLGRQLSVAYFDLDQFGELDSRVGHGNADLAIESVGNFLKSQTIPGSFVCHPHGDEFVLVYPTFGLLEAKEAAQTILDRLKDEAFQIPSRSGPVEFKPSASIGVALAEHGVSAQALVDSADEIHQRAKKQRGRVLASTDIDD